MNAAVMDELIHRSREVRYTTILRPTSVYALIGLQTVLLLFHKLCRLWSSPASGFFVPSV